MSPADARSAGLSLFFAVGLYHILLVEMGHIVEKT